MGRRSSTGGVVAAAPPSNAVHLHVRGRPLPPTLLRTPTEANLRRAREQLARIKAGIASGTFSFAEEVDSSVSWNLMIGKNPLWVARQHGHSVRTMLEIYAAWAEGAVESDIEAIKRAMGFGEAKIPAGLAIQGSAYRLARIATGHTPIARPLFSIWHWIWHQKWGACT